MHHSVSTVRFKNHSTKHLVPILTHAAHRRHKRRHVHLVWTTANVTILIVLAMTIGMLLGGAIYKATTGALAEFVCDAYTHMAVC